MTVTNASPIILVTEIVLEQGNLPFWDCKMPETCPNYLGSLLFWRYGCSLTIRNTKSETIFSNLAVDHNKWFCIRHQLVLVTRMVIDRWLLSSLSCIMLQTYSIHFGSVLLERYRSLVVIQSIILEDIHLNLCSRRQLLHIGDLQDFGDGIACGRAGFGSKSSSKIKIWKYMFWNSINIDHTLYLS